MSVHRPGDSNRDTVLGLATNEAVTEIAHRIRQDLEVEGIGPPLSALFRIQGFQVNVVRLPPEHDPDSFLQTEGAEGFRAALSQSVTGLDFMIHRAGERADLDTPRGKAEALSSLLAFVVPISNRVERAEWIARLDERLQLDARLVEDAAADVQAKGRRRQNRVRSKAKSSEQQDNATSWKAQLEKVTLAESELLRAVLEHPEWREQLEEKSPSDWDSARNCALGIYDDSLRRRLREINKDIRDALDSDDHELFGQLNKEKITLAKRIGSV